MRATTIHGTRDIRLSDVPEPTIEADTDAIVKVVAGCICGSDLWPYRGENPITPGDTIGHECVGVVEEVGAAVTSFQPGDFVVVPFDHCDNTCAHCRAGMQSACSNLGFTQSGQAEYARVTQAEGSMVKTDGMPDPGMIPSLLTLADVMATGWHAAVASGVTKGSTAVVVGDGAVGLCGVLAACQLGAERVIAMSRHEPRQEIAQLSALGVQMDWQGGELMNFHARQIEPYLDNARFNEHSPACGTAPPAPPPRPPVRGGRPARTG